MGNASVININTFFIHFFFFDWAGSSFHPRGRDERGRYGQCQYPILDRRHHHSRRFPCDPSRRPHLPDGSQEERAD